MACVESFLGEQGQFEQRPGSAILAVRPEGPRVQKRRGLVEQKAEQARIKRYIRTQNDRERNCDNPGKVAIVVNGNSNPIQARRIGQHAGQKAKSKSMARRP